MQNGQLQMRIKTVYYFLTFFAVLVSAVYLVFTITGFQMRYLSYLLYDKSHLSAVHRLLVQYVLRKLLFAVLLFLLALVMLYLFYFSYFQLTYLKLSIVCLAGVSYCVSMQETNTLFYIGTYQGQRWQNSGLTACMFLVLFLLYLTFDAFLETHSFLFIPCSTLCFLAFTFVIFSRRYAQNQALIPFLFLLLSTVGLVLWILTLRSGDYASLLTFLPVTIGCAWLLYANYVGRLRNYHIPVLNRRSFLYDTSMYAAVATILYALVVTVIHKRRSLMHSRGLNQKISELESSRHLLLGVLYSNVNNYLFSAQTALDDLSAQPELSAISRKDAGQLQNELVNIRTLYNQIHNYTIFSGTSIDMALSYVNMDIFFRLFSERLSYSDLLLPGDHIEFSPGNGYTSLYPEYILQLLEDLVILLRQKKPDGHLTIHGNGDGRQIQLSLSFCAGSFSKHSVKQRSCSEILPDLSDLDYTISTLRYQVRACHGSLSVSSNHVFAMQLIFPAAGSEPPECITQTVSCRNPAKGKHEHLLVITSDRAQMEQIQKILPYDQYDITTTNDAGYYMEHPQELGTYSMLIVGNLYRCVYFRDFYNTVRREYPMTSLPILMLLPDLYAENSFYIRSTINDYLIPPYSQASLEKKIHALVTVKRTADIALEAQLEFWQSQINPHFIFNSINSIMHMCIKEPMKAYELLDNFSVYLRGHLLSLSLDRQSTIQKEIDLISAYLQIEKARFGDKIHYELDIDCAQNFPILPLLIEPLVENSIKHGTHRESRVTVSIQIFQIENQLLVRVADNGGGMSEETIQRIMSDTSGNNSIGLSNVCSRLQHYYHTAPVIESTLGEGTTVQFTIREER